MFGDWKSVQQPRSNSMQQHFAEKQKFLIFQQQNKSNILARIKFFQRQVEPKQAGWSILRSS